MKDKSEGKSVKSVLSFKAALRACFMGDAQESGPEMSDSESEYVISKRNSHASVSSERKCLHKKSNRCGLKRTKLLWADVKVDVEGLETASCGVNARHEKYFGEYVRVRLLGGGKGRAKLLLVTAGDEKAFKAIKYWKGLDVSDAEAAAAAAARGYADDSSDATPPMHASTKHRIPQSMDAKQQQVRATSLQQKRAKGGLSRGVVMEDVVKELEVWSALRGCARVVSLEKVLVDEERGRVFAVMEYAPGGSILDEACIAAPGVETARMKVEGDARVTLPMEESEARRILTDVVDAVCEMHARGVVHGDIKPQNMLLASDGGVKLADFGNAFVFSYRGDDDDDANSSDGSARGRGTDVTSRSPGTPAFTAPECAEGPYSGRAADMWAIGVTAHLLLLGYLPFGGRSSYDVYNAIATCGAHVEVARSRIGSEGGSGGNAENFIESLLTRCPHTRLTSLGAQSHPFLAHTHEPSSPVSL